MSKNKKNEEIDEDLNTDDFIDELESKSEEFETESESEDELEVEIDISGSEDDIDIVIEINDEPDIVEPVVDDLFGDVVLSKHKMQGKHSLKYDSIFKGKKEEKLDEDEAHITHFNEKFTLDSGSFLHSESYDSEYYIKLKNVKEKVYKVLSEHTTLNFLNNRRKPSRVDFNNYFHLLKTNLKGENFSNIEIFSELSVYFSDNLFNMFKLLNNKWRNMVLSELRDHIGKTVTTNEITNRNIYIGTEVEFLHIDIITSEEKHYTGVVIETDYDNSTFKIDSYENIYIVSIGEITKILNNSKFKYNLNKLDNIDFL